MPSTRPLSTEFQNWGLHYRLVSFNHRVYQAISILYRLMSLSTQTNTESAFPLQLLKFAQHSLGDMEEQGAEAFWS